MLVDYPPALPSNPAVLKYFPKKGPVKEKEREKKAKEGGSEEGRQKVKVKTAASLLNPH